MYSTLRHRVLVSNTQIQVPWARGQVTNIPFRLAATELEVNLSTVSGDKIVVSYPALVPRLTIHCDALHVWPVVQTRSRDPQRLVTVHGYRQVVEPREEEIDGLCYNRVQA